MIEEDEFIFLFYELTNLIDIYIFFFFFFFFFFCNILYVEYLNIHIFTNIFTIYNSKKNKNKEFKIKTTLLFFLLIIFHLTYLKKIIIVVLILLFFYSFYITSVLKNLI